MMGRLCFDMRLSIHLSVHTWGGTWPGPGGEVPCWGGILLGGYPARSRQGGGYPARSRWGGTLLGGLPGQVQAVGSKGTRPGPGQGVPCQVQAGGVPGQVPTGGYPARSPWGYPHQGTPPQPGPDRGYPASSRRRTSQVQMGGGILTKVPPAPSQVQTGGGVGTQVGQQKEYLLHGGRYISDFLVYSIFSQYKPMYILHWLYTFFLIS